MKICKNCKVEQALENFATFKQKERTYYRSYCRPCDAKRANEPHNKAKKKQWRAANPEKAHLYGRRNHWKRQGIDHIEAEKYFLAHNGLCDLCHLPADGKTLVVDHCHTTGQIRGMLHTQCNTLLGMAKDSRRTLIMAIDYLDRAETLPRKSS